MQLWNKLTLSPSLGMVGPLEYGALEDHVQCHQEGHQDQVGEGEILVLLHRSRTSRSPRR